MKAERENVRSPLEERPAQERVNEQPETIVVEVQVDSSEQPKNRATGQLDAEQADYDSRESSSNSSSKMGTGSENVNVWGRLLSIIARDTLENRVFRITTISGGVYLFLFGILNFTGSSGIMSSLGVTPIKDNISGIPADSVSIYLYSLAIMFFGLMLIKAKSPEQIIKQVPILLYNAWMVFAKFANSTIPEKETSQNKDKVMRGKVNTSDKPKDSGKDN